MEGLKGSDFLGVLFIFAAWVVGYLIWRFFR